MDSREFTAGLLTTALGASMGGAGVGNLSGMTSEWPLLEEWFSTAAFVVPPLYTFGNAGRNTLRAQRYINLDRSVIRTFPFWRERSFEFRAETFNIFNHP